MPREDSGRWNRLNPNKVRDVQKRYAEKRKERRAALSDLEIAKEDLGQIFKRLSADDTQKLIHWVAQAFPQE